MQFETRLRQTSQESPSSLGIESFRLPRRQKLAVTQPHRAEVPDELARGVMQQHGGNTLSTTFGCSSVRPQRSASLSAAGVLRRASACMRTCTTWDW